MDRLGNLIVSRLVKVILSRGAGQLVGNTVELTNESRYAIFSKLNPGNTKGNIELTFVLDDEITLDSI
ncbi:hypothetical protein HMSSN139_55630 [Paenibacillus sp. HMSSN-139]|nr:hypothetical protein HMSSN139_55630 [Paenibacillus sp. HMSSN-139]